MESLKELFKIGIGPSSSHTIGPEKACKKILELYPCCKNFSVTLFGSLALTGKGHGTDVVIKQILGDNVNIIFDTTTTTSHPNTMDICGFDENQNTIFKKRIISVGGGKIKFENENIITPINVYPHNTFEEIKSFCKKENIRLYEYVFKYEPEIKEYLKTIWSQMKISINEGIVKDGVLPGGLNVERKAKLLYNSNLPNEDEQTKKCRIISAFAFAVSEQNASQGTVVTSPTCGSCGVIPAVFYYMYTYENICEDKIINALATSGIIGNVIKCNASLSGAECGCQAEIGSACAMASAGLAEIFDMNIEQIEYSAEVSLEHHLGLTCDPVKGLVQIPCIERNAVASMRAIDSVILAKFLTNSRKISLDLVIKTMYETGKDMLFSYKETSKGGLAKMYRC